MRSFPRILPLALAVAGALNCSLLAQTGPPASPPPAAAPLPSLTMPPELERILRDYEKAWKAKDIAALAELFTEDGFVMQNGRPPARGRDAVKAAYAGQGGDTLTLRTLAYTTHGPVGYVLGAYRFGDSAEDQGKFTLTIQRDQKGRWLIFSDMDSPNRRPGPPPGGPRPPGAGGPPGAVGQPPPGGAAGQPPPPPPSGEPPMPPPAGSPAPR